MATAGAAAKPDEIIFVLACGNFNKTKNLKERFDDFINDCVGVPFWCLGQNLDGSPKHPLFIKSSTPLVKYERFK